MYVHFFWIVCGLSWMAIWVVFGLAVHPEHKFFRLDTSVHLTDLSKQVKCDGGLTYQTH